MFRTILKLEYIKPAVKSAEKDIIKWKMIVTVLKLKKQKTHNKSNQKKTKWINKKKNK